MRRTLLGACAVMAVSAALASVSGQTPDPFVGTWKTNIAKSQYDPASMAPKSPSILTREAVGTGFTVTSDGVNGQGIRTHIEYSFSPDGKDYPIKGTTSADSVAVIYIDANTQVQMRKKDGAVVAMYRQVVSKDGKTLTSAEVGYRVHGDASHNVLVFDRQ
jgi:hypothetical protein